MAEPKFRDWLLAVAPRFPEFEELSQVVKDAHEWPTGRDLDILTRFLNRFGRRELKQQLVRALDTFEFLCTPDAPMPDEMRTPWDWHNPRMVEQGRASIRRHTKHRDVSTARYRWELGHRLSAQMRRVKKIFVDTCHWVKMRDYEMGRDVPQEYGEILSNLRWLVATQRYICPITPSLFLEVQTQTDGETRMRTVSLMEELSRNVALPDVPEMEKLEVRRRAFDTFFGTGSLNTDWQVWTKVAFLLGERWPAPETDWLGERDLWWVQKCYLDSMWHAPFTQIMGVLREPLSTADLRQDFANAMNADRRSRPTGDFEYERQRALAVVIKQIILPVIARLVPELERVASRRPGYRLPEIGGSEAPDQWCLPSVQIIAGIEALVRTSGRRFRPNDMFDLYHCAAALPYYDVFFCDGPFERMIKDSKLQYDQLYGVEVFSSPGDMLKCVKTLG